MKTSIKLVGMTITMLLLALPAGAADYTLGVFGNANGDDTIDMVDVTYTERIIMELNDETQLADAKYDGEIDILDVTQIELIILGRDKEMTMIDDTGEVMKFFKPIESFVYHGHNSYIYETLRAIGVSDKIVGTSDRFVTPGKCRYSEAYYPELCGFTNVGILKSPDYEVVNNLKPDVVISDEEQYYDRTKTPDIPLIANDVRLSNFREATMKYGYIFDRVDEAEEYIDWFNDWEDVIDEKVETISEDEKPLILLCYFTPGATSFSLPARDSYRSVMARKAGGDYIGDIFDGAGSVTVDAEWVMDENPDVIIFSGSTQFVGYDIEDPSEVIAMINDFTSRPELANVNAVKNERVYVVSHAFLLCGGGSGLIGTAYFAKWMHPDLFADMNIQEMHQEFVTDFQHLDLDTEACISAYPPP
jgi:iron complex transport system substrate-binding protein